MKVLPSLNWESRRALAMAALFLAAANLAVHWPGNLTPDSNNQLSQAMTEAYTDWHPPLMAKIWALLGGTPQAMLALQITLHWFGFWSLAETLRRGKAGKWPWAMLAVGLTPIAIKYTGVIQKDSLLAEFLITAFGLAALTGGHGIATIFGAAGALCRANAVFALPPLFLTRGTRMNLLVVIGLKSLSCGRACSGLTRRKPWNSASGENGGGAISSAL